MLTKCIQFTSVPRISDVQVKSVLVILLYTLYADDSSAAEAVALAAVTVEIDRRQQEPKLMA